ncbi:MAG: hypothetical protein U0T84_12690 [Chitinophagales bacterium]
MLTRIVKGIALTIVAVGLFFLLILGFQYLWNAIIPDVLHLGTITYWQALGLLVISRMLFGGFGFRWMNNSNGQRFWRERMKMKMQHMSDEEREEFKRRVRERCGM